MSNAQPELVTYGMQVVLPVPWNDKGMTVTVGWNDTVMLDPDTLSPVEVANNLETALTMIQEGFVGVAVNPNKQPALDHERALYKDCFGIK